MSTPTLESVKHEFDQWRQQKSSPQARCPQELREKALSLREHYRTSDILKALNISRARLDLWAGVNNQKAGEDGTGPDFIALPASAVDSSPNHNLQLTATTANGVSWSLQGQFNPEQLQAVMAALMTTRGGLV